ncbi:YibE/F family protein [Kurthia senegalensis]|uniref:YibE/F family protein n=1 Tax=Kurthia senegalensis TaxID=1033740 RepID=UPI0002894647|nr:YibE/F family protein [Kurthia senegalensis]
MNAIVVLALILFVLMFAIGGKKGIRSFIALFLNFIVVIVLLFFMNVPSLNPIVVTLIACIVISWINLFFINKINKKTQTAFVASIISTLVLVGVITFISQFALIQGFGEEETEELGAYSLYVGVDFMKIAISVIIMSTIGAITDAAIAISSPMQEMYSHQPTIDRKALFRFGMSIGRDIIGTSMNTLFFAFIGSYLALLIWFKDLHYSFGDIVNSKIFSGEVITICCSGLGVVLVIPITSWITAYYFTRKKVQ